MRLNCTLRCLIAALGALELVAASALAEDSVADGRRNEVNGLRVTLVERNRSLSAAPAGAVPQKALFLRWENVGKNALSLGGLFETACACGQVFVKGPDGILAPERQYREQGHWMERLVEPGKSMETDFDPWFWVQKPKKPGKYEVWVEYEVTKESFDKAPRRAVSAAHWQGKIISNRLEVEVE